MSEKIVIFIILILLSAFFSALEIAYFSLSPGKVRTMVRKGLRGAATVERLKKNPRRLLILILIGNNLVNVLAAALATEVAISSFGSVGVGIATGLVTLLLLVFGEIFPKAVAQVHARNIARYTSRVVIALEFILFPLVYFFERLSAAVLRLIPRKSNLASVHEDDVMSMMHVGEEEGSVESHEREFVERLFKFNDVKIKAVMTSIDKVIMLDGEQTVGQVSLFAANSGYSRFPVFAGNKENLVGVIHIKDIFKFLKAEKQDSKLISIMQKAEIVNQGEDIDEVLRKIQKDKTHYMLVENNKKIVGIVTLEDLLEELVGEIYDESDIRKVSVIT